MRTVIVATIAILVSVYVRFPVPADPQQIGTTLGTIAFIAGAMLAVWQDVKELSE